MTERLIASISVLHKKHEDGISSRIRIVDTSKPENFAKVVHKIIWTVQVIEAQIILFPTPPEQESCQPIQGLVQSENTQKSISRVLCFINHVDFEYNSTVTYTKRL